MRGVSLVHTHTASHPAQAKGSTQCSPALARQNSQVVMRSRDCHDDRGAGARRHTALEARGVAQYLAPVETVKIDHPLRKRRGKHTTCWWHPGARSTIPTCLPDGDAVLSALFFSMAVPAMDRDLEQKRSTQGPGSRRFGVTTSASPWQRATLFKPGQVVRSRASNRLGRGYQQHTRCLPDVLRGWHQTVPGLAGAGDGVLLESAPHGLHAHREGARFAPCARDGHGIRAACMVVRCQVLKCGTRTAVARSGAGSRARQLA